MTYVDVHTHLTDKRFHADKAVVIERAIASGLRAMIVNGLEPKSNREILGLAQTYPQVKAALGIYPIDAVNKLLPADFPHPVEAFDVDAEIAFIDAQADAGLLTAIGECGLDGHWLKADTFAEQERVFEALIEVATKHRLPLIIHTRKLEKRSMEILAHHRVERVNFHCFGGKTKLAQEGAETYGWWFSIPANARRSESFTKMLRLLPIEKILTETDAPYLAPEPGTRNEPVNVVQTVAYFASLRNLTVDDAREQVWMNYQNLFGSLKT